MTCSRISFTDNRILSSIHSMSPLESFISLRTAPVMSGISICRNRHQFIASYIENPFVYSCQISGHLVQAHDRRNIPRSRSSWYRNFISVSHQKIISPIASTWRTLTLITHGQQGRIIISKERRITIFRKSSRISGITIVSKIIFRSKNIVRPISQLVEKQMNYS